MKKRVAIPLAILLGLVFWFIVLGIIGSKMDPPQSRQQAEQAVTANESVQEPVVDSQQTAILEPEPQPQVRSARTDSEPEPKSALLEPIDPARTDIDPSIIKYDIATLEPGHIGVIMRYACRVVIYQRLSKAQLALIADTIYQYAQKEIPFNALGIYFYDYPQFIDDGTRLGFVQYAPNGRWADAGTVQTGDYTTMKVIDHLFEPDWTNALTEREANICNDFFELEHKYQETTTTGNEAVQANEKAQEEIAHKYGIKKEDVYRLWMKFETGYE